MAYRHLFAYFAEQRAVTPPQPKAVARNIRIGLSILTGIAASIAILFLVAMPQKRSEQFVYYVDGHRVYDETAAMQRAEDKLQMLATSMQKAQNSMAAFDRVHHSQQALQQFGIISNAFQQIELINNL